MARTKYAPPAVQQAMAVAQPTGVVPPVVDRKVLREAARWERKNRPVAIEQARRLAMALYHGKAIETPPFQLGLALGPGETLWAETWARCSMDRHPWAALDPSRLALSCWAITNRRLVGRLSSGLHTGWTWDQVGAYQADLTRGREYASVVVDGRPTLFYGPGVAPLAVALVWQLHGAVALLEHPGLAALRVQAKPRKVEEPMLALPAHNELEDLDNLLRGL